MRELITLALLLLLPGLALAGEDTCGWPTTPDTCPQWDAASELPVWADSRDGSDNLLICEDDPSDGCTTLTTFPQSNEASCGAPSAVHSGWHPNRGHGSNRQCGNGDSIGFELPFERPIGNSGDYTLVWKTYYDAYDGNTVGVNECGPGGPNFTTCKACCNPDGSGCGDLTSALGGSYKHVLIKSSFWQGGLKCATAQHDDVFQAPAGDVEINGSFIFQGVDIRNGDSTMANMKGFANGIDVNFLNYVLHDVTWGIDQDWQDDCDNRGIITGGGCGGGGGPFRPNNSGVNVTVWLIKVRHHGVSQKPRFGTGSSGGYNKIIMIDTPESDISFDTGVPARTVYADIEAAVTGGETLFPFAHLQCAGWATEPDNCVCTRGIEETIEPCSGPPAKHGGSLGGGGGASNK